MSDGMITVTVVKLGSSTPKVNVPRGTTLDELLKKCSNEQIIPGGFKGFTIKVNNSVVDMSYSLMDNDMVTATPEVKGGSVA